MSQAVGADQHFRWHIVASSEEIAMYMCPWRSPLTDLFCVFLYYWKITIIILCYSRWHRLNHRLSISFPHPAPSELYSVCAFEESRGFIQPILFKSNHPYKIMNEIRSYSLIYTVKKDRTHKRLRRTPVNKPNISQHKTYAKFQWQDLF